MPAAMAWAASTGSLVNFAAARCAVSVLLLPTYFMRLQKVLPVPRGLFWRAIWRPPCAAMIMGITVHFADFLRYPLVSFRQTAANGRFWGCSFFDRSYRAMEIVWRGRRSGILSCSVFVS